MPFSGKNRKSDDSGGLGQRVLTSDLTFTGEFRGEDTHDPGNKTRNMTLPERLFAEQLRRDGLGGNRGHFRSLRQNGLREKAGKIRFRHRRKSGLLHHPKRQSPVHAPQTHVGHGYGTEDPSGPGTGVLPEPAVQGHGHEAKPEPGAAQFGREHSLHPASRRRIVVQKHTEPDRNPGMRTLHGAREKIRKGPEFIPEPVASVVIVPKLHGLMLRRRQCSGARADVSRYFAGDAPGLGA